MVGMGVGIGIGEAIGEATKAIGSGCSKAWAAVKGFFGSTGEGATAGSIRDVLSGLKSGRSPGVSIVDSAEQMDSTFQTLTKGGKAIDPGDYPGQAVGLKDGTIVRMRNQSKSGGPAIDITFPDGATNKVHVQ